LKSITFEVLSFCEVLLSTSIFYFPVNYSFECFMGCRYLCENSQTNEI